MSTKVVSDVQRIECTIDRVYNFLSDFNRIGTIINMARQMGGEQMASISDKIEDIRTTEDSCSFIIKGVGEMGMKIV